MAPCTRGCRAALPLLLAALVGAARPPPAELQTLTGEGSTGEAMMGGGAPAIGASRYTAVVPKNLRLQAPSWSSACTIMAPSPPGAWGG